MRLRVLQVSCALLLATVVAWLVWPHYLIWSATNTLNRLYVQYRPFPYRWIGADFSLATIKESTNGCAAVPEAKLAESRLKITEAELRIGRTSAILQQLGRVDIMLCLPTEAIQKYKLALLLDPDNPSLNLELGIAFALDANMDPQLDQQGALDYEAAMERMLRSGRLRHSAEFLFDSALLFEAAQLPLEAEEQWTEAATVDNSEQWRSEDHKRGFELQSRIDKRQQRILQFSSLLGVALKESDDMRDGSELALDTAVEKWLPKIGQPAVSRRDLQKLGDLLVSYHHDRWLIDVMKATPFQNTEQAFQYLAASVHDNLKGEHLSAKDSAQKAEELFEKSHNLAGELRARVEMAYASQRLSDITECLCALGLNSSKDKQHTNCRKPQSTKLVTEAERRSYTWIAAQARLEEITCRTLPRDEDVIKLRRQAYDWISTQTEYEGLRLRALGFQTEEYVSADSRLTLWRRGEQGLRSFWKEPLPALRGYSLYYTLADSAHQAGNSNTAIALLREGSLLLKQDEHKLIRASMLSYLGTRQLEANFTQEADATFREMEGEYAGLDFRATQGFRGESEVIHAAALISTGNPQQGLQRLERLTATSPWPFKDLVERVRRPLFSAFGDAYVRLNRLPEACTSYRQPIQETVEHLQAIHDPAQRDNGLHEIEPAWRGMTAVMLKLNHAADALATWEEFRSSRHFTDIAALHQNPDCSASMEDSHFPAADGVNILVYASLPGGLSGWIVNRHGIEQHWIDSDRAVELASRFAKLVATKDSPLKNVSATSRELYDLLLGPFDHSLPPHGTIVIDAEGALAGIPWQAMEDRTGHPLIERFAFCQTIGLADVLGDKATPQIDLSKALVFGSPLLPKDLADQFPDLPDALLEAEKLHHDLPGSLLFKGKDATAEAFRKHAPDASLIHFAGHGVSYGGFGALLLAGLADKGHANDSYFTAHEIGDIGLQHMQLVVLASCSSGVGEQSGIVNLDSLARAFLEAGAQRVIASSWEVDSSSTADLMAAFYDRLERGTGPAESLRQAQLTMREKMSHPYYWAGFRVFGSP
jgi:CHAT domain-containing protein